MGVPPDLRWKLADDDPQQALFAGEVTRHQGKGEFRGMEFIHVNAKTIINEVPAASKVPFRYTINAYRGCSHACTYCLAGETPILMANGRTLPLAALGKGDMVYGTVKSGSYRRYVPTRVLAHWMTVKPAHRITLQDGTELVASGDHRFLSDRGWKHVTGSERGRDRRSHLTPNNRLIGPGGFVASPEHDAEYRDGYLCGMIRGDGSVGTYSYPRPGRTRSEVHRFRLALIDLEALRRTREFLSLRGVETQEFLFQEAVAGRSRRCVAIRSQKRSSVETIQEVIEWPAEPTGAWCRGFLAGIFDSEGSHGGAIRICNSDPVILDWIGACLERFGFRYVVEPPTANGCRNVRVLGGLSERLRFFLSVDPAITRKRTFDGLAVKGKAPLAVKSIEPLGVDIPMFDITTGTGDFVASGVISHNCFARPTHEYLGMNSGEDFDKRIVVKVNAVERLRAELSPARWAGEHIAMGTNTDPYQRCEGKYRLTRGIVEVLAEARNPFSILTKSTLILRDLDVLSAAAERADVRANFSIGTLDEEVWRSSEPGTPHPLRRVEAVARLNQAGVRCGVLIAPVLPGLSDEPHQLEAVVKACVDAGAASISPILLHLRPGVRDQYLRWLEATRPDLVEEYRRLYPKSYAPRRTQAELTALVRQLVAKHGGRVVEPGQTRDVVAGKAARQRAAPRQLGLGL